MITWPTCLPWPVAHNSSGTSYQIYLSLGLLGAQGVGGQGGGGTFPWQPCGEQRDGREKKRGVNKGHRIGGCESEYQALHPPGEGEKAESTGEYPGKRDEDGFAQNHEIGRASCRERV